MDKTTSLIGKMMFQREEAFRKQTEETPGKELSKEVAEKALASFKEDLNNLSSLHKQIQEEAKQKQDEAAAAAKEMAAIMDKLRMENDSLKNQMTDLAGLYGATPSPSPPSPPLPSTSTGRQSRRRHRRSQTNEEGKKEGGTWRLAGARLTPIRSPNKP